MKKLLILLPALTLISCYQERPVLSKNEYKVVDTTYVARNGFGTTILEYDVIIEIDSEYYAGSLNSNKELIRVNPRKLKYKK